MLYTGVLLFMTAGTAAHTAHQALRIGLTPAAISDWYRGNEADLEATTLLFPKTFEEVMGDASLAVSTYALALLVLGGVLARSGLARRTGGALLVAYLAGAVILAATPFLIRYSSPGWAVPASAALLALPVVAAALSGLAIWEMWARRGRGPRFDPARAGKAPAATAQGSGG